MGNKFGKRRHAIDDRYTKPQGIYSHKDFDHKKLKMLILESKLAPCYPGEDDSRFEYEDCLICFMYYPSLNRSRCCMKGICTECFLQMKSSNSTRPAQCPFCKTSNYAVEYFGHKSIEEKILEQIEEQRFIEAKIRIRREEERAIYSPTKELGFNNSTTSSPSALPNEDVIFLNKEEHDGLVLEDIILMEALRISTNMENAKPENIENNDGGGCTGVAQSEGQQGG